MRSKRAALSLVALLAAGCARMPGLYAELGAGVKLEESTSAVIRPGCQTVTLDGRQRSCGGDNPTAHLAIGFEFRRPWRCELEHWSHYLDGGEGRELHKDEIRCIRRFGGRGAKTAQ